METYQLNLTFPMMFNPITWDAHLFPVYFGGSVITEDLTILTVPSVQLAYFLLAGSKRQDAMWVYKCDFTNIFLAEYFFSNYRRIFILFFNIPIYRGNRFIKLVPIVFNYIIFYYKDTPKKMITKNSTIVL